MFVNVLISLLRCNKCALKMSFSRISLQINIILGGIWVNWKSTQFFYKLNRNSIFISIIDSVISFWSRVRATLFHAYPKNISKERKNMMWQKTCCLANNKFWSVVRPVLPQNQLGYILNWRQDNPMIWSEIKKITQGIYSFCFKLLSCPTEY